VARDAEEQERRTRAGRRIPLLANIGRPFEIERVVEHHLEGLSLFRAEYPSLGETDPPLFEQRRSPE
jgi:phosphoenolpyruvate-protein kinase (PTS system EI component)